MRDLLYRVHLTISEGHFNSLEVAEGLTDLILDQRKADICVPSRQ